MCASKNQVVRDALNLIQLFINEVNVYGDLFLGKKHAIGLNLSLIYPNPIFKVFVLSSDQGVYPGTVYKGVGGRISYKFYYSRDGERYFAFQLAYKNLYYHNTEFENDWRDNSNVFVQSEDAFVMGFDLLHGKHLRTMSQNNNAELFYGLGLRYRERYITITKSEAGYFPDPKKTGTFLLIQRFPVLILGLKFGYTSFASKMKKIDR